MKFAEMDLLSLGMEALKGVRPRNMKYRKPLEKGPGGCAKASVLRESGQPWKLNRDPESGTLIEGERDELKNEGILGLCR